MKRGVISVIFVFCFSSSPAFGSSFLELACKNDETKGYCMSLLQGFLTGYKTGYRFGTVNATATEGEGGPELCIPHGLSAGDIYEDMYPYLNKDLEFVDLALFSAALEAYPCESNEDQ